MAVDGNSGPETPNASHRVVVPGGRWEAWRVVGLRGAGFPAHQVKQLSSAELGRATLDLIAAGHPAKKLEPAWKDAMTSVFERAVGVARDPLFREAIVWQNRPLIHQTLDRFLAKPKSRGWKNRQRVAVIARYLQRYCTKNETIGFFGPWGWAHIEDEGPRVTVHSADELLASRAVYFEQWPLDTLAETLNERLDVRAWAKPRLQPFLHVADDGLVIPGEGVLPLPPAHVQLLRACDGTQTGREVAELAVELGTAGCRNVELAYGLLAILKGLGLLAWGLELPLSPHPERELAAQLEAIDDEDTRAAAFGLLTPLVEARDRVVAAAGDAQALDEAIQHLETLFHETTSADVSRRAGQISAGRTLLYEDTLRAAEVTFGPGFLDSTGPALTLVLEAFKWLTFRIAEHYLGEIGEMFDTIAKERDREELDLGDLYLAFATKFIFTDDDPGRSDAVERILAEYAEKWNDIFGDHDPHAAAVTRSSADIAARVAQAFAAPRMGWPGAYLTPNLLIAAANTDALNEGDFLAVLGKMHPGNTFLKAALSAFFPDHDELAEQLRLDHPEPHIAPIPPRELGARRTTFTTTSPINRWLHFSPDPPLGAPEQRLPLSDLVARRHDGSIQISTRDGSLHFDVVEVLAVWLAEVVHSASNILPREAYRPRRVIDNLVIERAQWTYDAADLAFAHTKGAMESYVEFRRWAQEQRLPHYTYVKVDGEPKPVFVDLDSPIFVDVAARMIRGAAKADPSARASFTEMLPALDDLWLEDHEGNAVTTELLLVTVPPA